MINLTDNKEEKYLYKYLPFNQYTLQILINYQLWLGSPDFLNDPFEGDFVINNFKQFYNEENIELIIDTLITGSYRNLTKSGFRQGIIEDESKFLSSLYEYLSISIKNNFGTTSFSKNCKSLKMWSHYADSHKGIVLIFNKDVLNSSIEKSRNRQPFLRTKRDIQLINVEYGSLTTVDLVKTNGVLKIIDDSNILSKKLKLWKNEEEVRIIEREEDWNNNQRYFHLAPNCIDGVIFGQRISSINRNTITTLLPPLECDIVYYQAQKSTKRNNIIFKRMTK